MAANLTTTARRRGQGRCGRRRRVPPAVAHRVRRAHHPVRRPAALLQQHPGNPRQHRLLAAHRLLPRRDVHPPAADPAVQRHVAGAAGPQHLLLRHHRRGRGCLGTGRARLAQNLRALPDQVVMSTARTVPYVAQKLNYVLIKQSGSFIQFQSRINLGYVA
ncbi:Amino acid permease 6 [Zea mays]|uniref:Amino acid permease 6 n=1 Tax=Zea mays TaxID=4577 RepID=A0A1D6LT17_MAIZE|nr:Amino acid permease 6 [Zea mays]